MSKSSHYHYLHLLAGAGLITGLQKYAGGRARQRASSPKFQVFNTALITAQAGMTLAEAQADRAFWGRLVESAVGAHVANAAATGDCSAYYWRERNREVDFIVRSGKKLVALEVQSGRAADARAGMSAFSEAFRPTRKLLVGGDGIDVETFLLQPVEDWLNP